MKKIKFYIKKAFKTFNQPEMRILPGNVAFFFALALIPIITLIVIIVSYFSVSIEAVINFIQHVFPEEIGNVIIDVISGRGFDSSVGLFNLIAFFVATNGTYSIISASNTLYQIKEHDLVKDRVKSVLILFILLLLIVFLITVPLFGRKILSLLGSGAIVDELRILFDIFQWPISIFLIYINLKLIYTIAPNAMVTSKSTTYGAIFTTVIWTITTAIFSYYLNHFANYNVIYGNLSNLIILMMWLYIISYVFVLGIAINVTNWEDS